MTADDRPNRFRDTKGCIRIARPREPDSKRPDRPSHKARPLSRRLKPYGSVREPPRPYNLKPDQNRPSHQRECTEQLRPMRGGLALPGRPYRRKRSVADWIEGQDRTRRLRPGNKT